MTSHCITWHDTTQAMTLHQMTWPSHDLIPQQTSRHQNTSLQSTRHHHHGTAEGSFTVHSKEMIWASRWSVALRTFYRQILSLLYSCFLLEASAPGLSGHYWYTNKANTGILFHRILTDSPLWIRHSVEMRSPNQAPKYAWNSKTGKLRKRRVFPSRWQCFPVFCSKNEAGNGSFFLEIGNHMKSPSSFTRCRCFHCYKVCFTRVYIP